MSVKVTAKAICKFTLKVYVNKLLPSVNGGLAKTGHCEIITPGLGLTERFFYKLFVGKHKLDISLVFHADSKNGATMTNGFTVTLHIL